MANFSLPEFLRVAEAQAIAQRLLNTKLCSLPVEAVSATAFYVSWEFQNPTLHELLGALKGLPEYLHAASSHGRPLPDLLSVSPCRLQAALEKGWSSSSVMSELKAAADVQDLIFADTEALEHAVRTALAGLESHGNAQEALAAEVPAEGSSQPLLPAPTAQAGQLGSGGGALVLYQKEAVREKWAKLAADEGNAGVRQLLLRMEKESAVRPLTPVPAANGLADLREKFPHFGEVLDFVEQALALAGTGTQGRPVMIAPLLLRGAPGTGKSYFAQELSRALGCRYHEKDLSITSEAFVLTGMDPSWKNAKAGLVFEALFNGPTANPFICLNEVDKAKTSRESNSPLAALYTLLEPANSRIFKDEFAGVCLDASRIVWVLTANDGDLPEPILSRVEVFDIPLPTPDQCRAIARSVWLDLRTKEFPEGHPFVDDLESSVVEEVLLLRPRLMRRVLRRAAGQAALQGRTRVSVPDTAAAARLYRVPTGPSMGFLA